MTTEKTIKQLKHELVEESGDMFAARKILTEELHAWYKETCHLPAPKESQEKVIYQRAIDRAKKLKAKT